MESGKIRRIFFRVNQQWAMTRAILAIFPRVAFMAKKIQTDAQRVPNDFTETRFRAEMPRWTGRVFMFSHFGGLQHEVFAEACMVWQPIFFSHFRFFEHGTDVQRFKLHSQFYL